MPLCIRYLNFLIFSFKPFIFPEFLGLFWVKNLFPSVKLFSRNFMYKSEGFLWNVFNVFFHYFSLLEGITMKQLTILTENKVGVLASIASLLGRHGVNMESISAETFPDGAIIRVITKDIKTAREILRKADYNVIESDIMVLEVMDRPGELGKVAKKLAEARINIENIYLISRTKDKALLALRVDNTAKARKIFKDSLIA